MSGDWLTGSPTGKIRGGKKPLLCRRDVRKMCESSIKISFGTNPRGDRLWSWQ